MGIGELGEGVGYCQHGCQPGSQDCMTVAMSLPSPQRLTRNVVAYLGWSSLGVFSRFVGRGGVRGNASGCSCRAGVYEPLGVGFMGCIGFD